MRSNIAQKVFRGIRYDRAKPAGEQTLDVVIPCELDPDTGLTHA
jgi:hypothetical protein